MGWVYLPEETLPTEWLAVSLQKDTLAHEMTTCIYSALTAKVISFSNARMGTTVDHFFPGNFHGPSDNLWWTMPYMLLSAPQKADCRKLTYHLSYLMLQCPSLFDCSGRWTGDEACVKPLRVSTQLTILDISESLSYGRDDILNFVYVMLRTAAASRLAPSSHVSTYSHVFCHIAVAYVGLVCSCLSSPSVMVTWSSVYILWPLFPLVFSLFHFLDWRCEWFLVHSRLLSTNVS